MNETNNNNINIIIYFSAISINVRYVILLQRYVFRFGGLMLPHFYQYVKAYQRYTYQDFSFLLFFKNEIVKSLNQK